MDEVRRALASGAGVRAAGARAAGQPVVRDARHGARDERPAGRHGTSMRRAVTSRPSPRRLVGAFGPCPWEAGLRWREQGDIDTQAMAGAIATGTRGSRNALPSFSAWLRACRLVTGHGEVVEMEQVATPGSSGLPGLIEMLGMMTSLAVKIASAYRRSRARSSIRRSRARCSRRWDGCVRQRIAVLRSSRCRGGVGASCTASPRRPAGGGRTHARRGLRRGRRQGCPETTRLQAAKSISRWRIYVSERLRGGASTGSRFASSPWSAEREAVTAMRELMLARPPDTMFPLEVRTTSRRRAPPPRELGHGVDGRLGLGRARAPTARPTSSSRPAAGRKKLEHARALGPSSAS